VKDFIFENKSVNAALYFLESGHFLFRSKSGNTSTSKTLAMPDVAAAFTGKDFDSGPIPSGIKRFGTCPKGEWALLVVESRRVEISLDYSGEIKTAEVIIPDTALLGIGTEYAIFALGPDGRVYSPPFPNVNRSGGICFGSNKVLQAKMDNMEKMWRLFFESPFNNHLANNKSKKYPADVRDMLLEVQEQGISYPLSDLNLEESSIDQVLNSRLRGYLHAG
jgi:hypothetical protein